VKQLSPAELHVFTEWLVAWQQQDGSQEDDAVLVQATKTHLPAADAQRLQRLITKSEGGTLTPKELDTYRTLAQRSEQLNVRRVEALAELVRRRGKATRVIMEEIGWESGTDGA
jgi:hypothetical protein